MPLLVRLVPLPLPPMAADVLFFAEAPGTWLGLAEFEGLACVGLLGTSPSAELSLSSEVIASSSMTMCPPLRYEPHA